MEPIAASSIDRTQLPADIRTASTEDQQNYAAAQQFEQMLVQKMLAQATSLLSSDDAESDGGSVDGEESEFGGGTDAVSTHYKEMLPQLMAKSMTAGDGIGIARDMFNAMQQAPKP